VPWQQGQQLRYRSQSSADKTKGKLHTRIQTQDVTELSILEAGPGGFVQQWRSASPEVAVTGDGDQVASERKVAQALVARFRTLRCRRSSMRRARTPGCATGRSSARRCAR
jgi:hypothetical protein